MHHEHYRPENKVGHNLSGGGGASHGGSVKNSPILLNCPVTVHLHLHIHTKDANFVDRVTRSLRNAFGKYHQTITDSSQLSDDQFQGIADRAVQDGLLGRRIG